MFSFFLLTYLLNMRFICTLLELVDDILKSLVVVHFPVGPAGAPLRVSPWIVTRLLFVQTLLLRHVLI